jgi:hypothetical protein
MKLLAIFENAERLARGDFDARLGKQWDLHRA